MRLLHIAPSDSAGGGLRAALRQSGWDDQVVSWLDDLSCGPIESDAPPARAAWWEPFHSGRDVEGSIAAFWNRVTAAEDKLVVWFGRQSALELSFFLAWAERLGERQYHIVDVTGLRLPLTRKDGSPAMSRPQQSVSLMSVESLASLLGTERPITIQEKEDASRRWQRLKRENAPFRIVADDGLVSAPIDVFDHLLMERATTDWRRVISIVAETMGYNAEPYLQSGDVMLLTRLVALVGAGRLLADGDPWDMVNCRVRLPA